MAQNRQMTTNSRSLGDLAVDGLLHGLAAGAIMLAFLVAIGVMEGVAPAAVLARFGLPDSASVVTGLLGHLAVSAVLGLVWGVLYGSLLRRTPLPAWLLGAAFISEGAIPFAAADIFRVIPAMMLGGAVTGALSMAFAVTSKAPHGGLFVFFAIDNFWLWLVAIAAGTVVAAFAVVALKRFAHRRPVDGVSSGAAGVPSALANA